MQNGIPWWYFQGHGGPYEGRHVEAVDPSGVIARTIDPRRIIGTVMYPAATVAAPEVIRHIEGRRFPLGELDGSLTERASAISGLFELGALVGTPTPCITTVYALVKLLSKMIAEKQILVRSAPISLQRALEALTSPRDAPTALTSTGAG